MTIGVQVVLGLIGLVLFFGIYRELHGAREICLSCGHRSWWHNPECERCPEEGCEDFTESPV